MFLLFFLLITYTSLISRALAQIFNATMELVIPMRIPGKEEKAETEMQSVNAKAKIRKCSI